jgi:hypothetical protein
VATHFYYCNGLVFPAILALLLIVGFFNSIQPRHVILRNFPVLGYLRYSFDTIALEIQQYFIERNTDGKSFSRNEHALAYQRAKNIEGTTPFGTQLDINQSNNEGIKHSVWECLLSPH